MLAVSAICAGLGTWQGARYARARAWIARSEARMREAPATLQDSIRAPDAEWRRVVAEGVFEPTETVLLEHQSRERPDGRSLESGVKVITPLRTDSGLLLVDRGFLPAPSVSGFLAADPASPTDHERVEGVLRPLQRRRLPAPVERRLRWHRVDLAGLEQQLGEPLLPWLLIRIDAPGPPHPEPIAPRPTPRVDHLNYAITWFSISAIALLSGVFGARRARPGDALRARDRRSSTPRAGART